MYHILNIIRITDLAGAVQNVVNIFGLYSKDVSLLSKVNHVDDFVMTGGTPEGKNKVKI